MENFSENNFSNGSSGPERKISGKRSFKFFAGFFLIMILAVAGIYYAVNWYRDPVRIALKNQRIIEDAYRNDTYGGKTPQETLNMFIDALRKGDIDLASKYFALDNNLSREQGFKRLSELAAKNLIVSMVSDLTRARPDIKNNLYPDNFKFVIYTTDGQIGADIEMNLNPISKVWKIEAI